MKILKTILSLAISFFAMEAAATDIANFSRYEDDNERIMALPNTGTRVVFMGNSITDFWPTTRPEFFVLNDFVGRGIAGQTSFEMLMRFREDVVRLNPAGVVIAAGTNDIAQNLYPWYDEERTLGNILSMAEIAQANNIQVFLASVLPVSSFDWNPTITNHEDKIESLNARIKEYADAHDIPYVDYYSAMVYGDRDLNYGFSNDGVHPNEDGYRVMEGILLPIIRERIRFEGSVIPETVELWGTAIAEDNPVMCTKVSVTSFEAFVELKAGGMLSVKNEKDVIFSIYDNMIKENGMPMRIQKDGVYCISLDFLNKVSSVKEVTDMCVLNCFTRKSMADLSYAGNGEWTGDWTLDFNMPWGTENRYRMMMTIDGEKVYWGPTFGADNGEPDGSDSYFEMMRVVPANTWANTWRMPLSMEGKTVKVTAVLRGKYTHRYSDKSSLPRVEVKPSRIIANDQAKIVCLADAVIYDTSGLAVASVKAGEIINLSEGVYIAKSGTIVEKFVIKK